MDLGFESYVPFIAKGLGVTAEAFLLGLLVAAPSAFALGLLRNAPTRWLTAPAAAFVEFFRGTSALVQLFWAFYALPFLGINLSPMLAGVLVIGLNEGSYTSEVVRAGIRSVPQGQVEAARTLGLSRVRTLYQIVLPQALPIMLPNIANSVIDLLKFTSLLSLVTVSDLTERALSVQQTTGSTLPTLGGILVVYYALSLIVDGIMSALERRALVRVGSYERPQARRKWRLNPADAVAALRRLSV